MGGAYESFYGGGGSSLNPKDGNPFVGYRLNPIQLGFSTNPTQGPDQLKEVMRGIRAGSRVIEVNLLNIQGDHDEQIPKQHFREMRALMKLTGVKPSVHGPLVDAAGIERGSYSKEKRMDHENRMFHAMEKATMWDDQIKNVTLEKRYVDQALKEVLENTASDVIRAPDGRIRGTDEGEIGLKAFNQLFNQAYKYGSDEQKKELRKLNEFYEEEMKELKKEINEKKFPVLDLKI